MKKRLALLGVLICSIFCMFGCNNDPYKNMSLEYSGQQTVQLNIEEVTVGGQTSYSYTPYTFDVKVGNVSDDVSKLISVSGGEDLVDYSLTYMGGGITRVEVTPLSYAKTGKFKLTLTTQEGNRSASIDFQIDLKINNFTINSENLEVIAKGQSVDLNAIDRYINFYPQATTQKNIEWEVVRPVDNVILGHAEKNYVYDDNCTDVYATIENGILKTFKNVEYPKMVDNVIAGEGDSQVLTQCITLKAHSKDAYNYDENGNAISQYIPDRYVDIVIIENCENITLKMNCQKNTNDIEAGNYGDSFALERNKNGEYDVTLINPNYRYGMNYESYYIERDLMFDFGVVSDDGTYNPNDYFVSTDAVLEDDNKPIVLSYSTLDNSFKVQAQTSGKYSHTFKIDNSKYPNIIDTEIVVNFNVIDIPTDIKVNGTVIKDEYKIYKNYGNSWGTRFTVSLINGTNYSYFVYVKDTEIGNNLKIYKADGSEQVLAKSVEEGGVQIISSMIEGSGYSNFNTNETFYLRHNFDTLPSENANIYIGILFDVVSDSYSEEVREYYFYQSLVSFELNLSFETGIQSLDFSKNKYIVDLTNKDYSSEELDATGIKLFDLPAGLSFEDAIGNDNIIYDKNLITVYPVVDYAENITSLYMKCNSEYKVGETKLTVNTKNGISKTVTVETFIPTVYAENENLAEEDQMPLSIGFNESEVLYYFTGKMEGQPTYKYNLFKTGENGQEQWGSYEYSTFQKLFMLKDTSMSMRFYDYLLTEEDGEKICTPIDITNQVSVKFNYQSYASYSNGRLTCTRVTEDINNPVIMTVTYNGGYITINNEGEEEYQTYTVTKEIELYIYLALQGVQVTTAKSVEIYVNESLGIYSKDLSKHTIISDFIPNEVNLGAEWNDNWFNASLPVNLWFDINDTLKSPIYMSDGSQLILYSNDGSKSRPLVYGDLFATVEKGDYTCPLECRINSDGEDSLDYWIRYESGYDVDGEKYDWFVKNKIFNNNITMIVNVYITQFSKLQNINSVKVTAKYASKISNFTLDVAQDGVYFEKRNNTNKMEANIAYSIDATNAVNKEIMLINSSNTVFDAIVNANALGTKGTIKIIGSTAGIQYLTAVPKDNIKSYNEVTKEYEYYNDDLVQIFRVKVADGSEDYPFEIRDIEDYEEMQNDVINNNYYNYILTTNLNISQLKNPCITFASVNGKNKLDNFSLNGQYDYFRNNIYYYSDNSINNLHIKKTLNNLTEDVNIGLFEYVNQKVTIKNLTLKNAKIELSIVSLGGKNLNVGILAGVVNDGNIENCSVIGSIKIYNLSADSKSSNINIGGMVGCTQASVTISGLPSAYLDGNSSSPYNANVTIDYLTLKNDNGVDNALNNHIFNVGGIVGLDTGSSYSTFKDLRVLPTIMGLNYNSSVGGFIGKTHYSKISNVFVYPIINIADKIEKTDNVLNISTFVGSIGDTNTASESVKIENSKVYFVKEGYTDWEDNLAVRIKTNSNLNFGGIIANLNNSDAEIGYTYVRSFYSQDLDDKYYANIYINAQNGANIGGIVGSVNNKKLTLNNSYFNADILVRGKSDSELCDNNYIGILLGNKSNIGSGSSINNSYGISRVTLEYIDGTTNKFATVKNLDVSIGLVGNLKLNVADKSKLDLGMYASFIDVDGTIKSSSISNLTIENTYGVLNENVYFLGKNDEIIGLYGEDKYILGSNNGMIKLYDNAVSESWCITLFKTLGYNILEDGAEAKANNNENWLWNDSVNKVKEIAFPILLDKNKTKALYDLIPEKILVDRIATDVVGVYDISYTEMTGADSVTIPQLLVFVNKTSGINKGNYFDIAVNSDKSTVSIVFDSQNIITSFLEISSDLEITEDSGEKVLSLKGFKVYPVGEGVATITLRSVLDKTVKLDIKVKVISGITSLDLRYDNDVETTAGNNPIVYIDEAISVRIENSNVIDDVSYDCNYKFGYKLEIIDSTDNGKSGKNGKISINGKEFEYSGNAQNDEYILNTSMLVIRGIKNGQVKFKLYPVVYLDDLDGGAEYYILENICNEFTIECMARARDITVNKDELKIAPKNITNFKLSIDTSNVIINGSGNNYYVSICEIINAYVGNSDKNNPDFKLSFAKTDNNGNIQYEEFEASLIDGSYYISKTYEFRHELIVLTFSDITVRKASYDVMSSQNTYTITFNVSVSFDKDHYRKNANNYDLNTINYNFIFIPSSNKNISDNIVVSISPNIVTEIFTNYYTRGELLTNSSDKDEVYPSENESLFVVPGTNGLLKITLDEEFNDSSYIEVTLNNRYKDYVKVSQMVGVTNSYNFDNDNYTNYIDSYTNVNFRESISNSVYYGIKLSKLSINYDDQSYFSKTYFVKLFLERNYGDLDTIDITITSYKVETSGITKHIEKTVTYTITQLPLIEAKVDNDVSAVIGKGVKKELQLNVRGITKDIDFNISDENNKQVSSLYIVDENDNKVSVLDIDYISNGGKYFICADINADVNLIARINFKAVESVWGVRETTSADLKLTVVDFEIESISVERVVDGVVAIKHGENLILNTVIDYKNITVGDKESIEEYEKQLKNGDDGIVNLIEYASTGAEISNNINKDTISNKSLRLKYGTFDGLEKTYKLMNMSSTYNHIQLSEGTITTLSNKYKITYYIIRGTGITNNTSVLLRLVVPYVYIDGKLQISESLGCKILEIDFELKVEDTSSYDRPNPIETQDDLIEACNSNGGDFILLNNLELEDWKPIEATFSSLDGNGYTISVKSFSFSSIRGSDDSINVGIFSSISSSTLLKNITVDVSNLLISENEMLARVDKVANASESNYLFDANIDLSFVKKVNFGILAGYNEGVITNAKIVNMSNSSNIYYHIVTTQGYIDSTLVTTNIGGLVGENAESGAISNSFVGLNESSMQNGVSTIEIVSQPSDGAYNNVDDELTSVNVYPFVIAGGNNLAGVVSNNKGIISNTYTKALGLYNTYPAVQNSTTAGFVDMNSGVITGSHVEGRTILNYRAEEDKYKIESTGNVGGFVYTNTNKIDNSYSNVYLETQSAFTGGFVFTNSESGSISNVYTTSVNKNNLARGQFTGIGLNGRDVLNEGNYENCYYLVLDGESENDLEIAQAITKDSDFSSVNTWRGFSCTTISNSEGIWILKENETPRLASSTIDTNSFRRLTSTEEVEVDGNSYTAYVYEYRTYNLGSKYNPLIIENADNFAKYIIDNSVSIKYNGKDVRAFGVSESNSTNLLSQINTVRHVRIVNNLDFEKLTTATKYKDNYLYQMIFAGVLDGNGMSLTNMNINTEIQQLENFGIFAQVGLESNISSSQTVVKNMNISLRTYTSSDSIKAGVLAGTIINSSIINVTIDGSASDSTSNIVVGGRNMAGGLAGLIYSDDGGMTYLYDVTVKNIVIEATYGSLGGEIIDSSKENSNGLYNKFLIKNSDNEDITASFNSLYDKTNNETTLKDDSGNIRTDVSYAGTIAGVILANNYSTEIGESSQLTQDSFKYRTSLDGSTIYNVMAQGSITIRTADNSGGLFGYIGENTLIKNSKLIVGDNQIIRAFNFAGGIVAENHGVIEQCYVALADDIQETYDNNMVNSTYDHVQLFDNLSTTKYTVAIGGIAGYSSNGVILDSYSKIAVTKPLSYIAGGLVGYSEDYNYIAFSYATGAVYAQFITGGIVGLQVSTANKEKINDGYEYDKYTLSTSLNMDSTYSLINWNATSKDFDFRQKTTEKLYENQKGLYVKDDGSYYNFYVKMPEIGNLNMITTNANTYSSHNDYYVGSAIGYMIMKNKDQNKEEFGKIFIDKLTASDETIVVEKDNINVIANFADNFKNIVTTTLGLYSTSGTLEAGDKVDNYTSSLFNYYTNNSSYINLHSYRVAYISDLNKYDLYDIDSSKSNDYFDVFTYPQVFNQEYLEQMIGGYYAKIENSSQRTANVFKYNYNAVNRFDKSITGNKLLFINENNDNIWMLENYIPKYSHGVYRSTETITNGDELISAFSRISSGKIYKIQPSEGNKITLDISNASNVIAYVQTIRDLFVGVDENGKSPTADKRPTIVINIGKESENSINSLFNTLNGVTFEDINFEINYKDASFDQEKFYSSFGLFANSLQNSTINKCTFTLNVGSDIVIQNSGATDPVFNAKNIGILFGDVRNTTITNTEFTINIDNITLNDEIIENFGVFAGYVDNSTLKDNNYTFNIETITNKNSSSNVNIAGMIGVFNNSNFYGRNIEDKIVEGNIVIKGDKNFTITNNKTLSQLNISSFIAYSNNSTIKDMIFKSYLNVVNNEEITSEMNVSVIVSMSKYVDMSNIEVRENLEVSDMYNNIESANIGAIIGHDLGSSTLGKNGLVISYLKENITIDTMSLAVGGFVGREDGATNLVKLGEFAGEINVTNLKVGTSTTDAKGETIKTSSKTMIGGIVGYTYGLTNISNTLSSGKIIFKASDTEDLVSVYVGGIIGYANSTDISNFTVLTKVSFDTGYTPEKADIYISGVIGYNSGVFRGENGFVLFEFPSNDKINKYPVTNNSISSYTNNVFYCNELGGSDYSTDIKFNTFALADLYGSISEYSLLGKTINSNSFFGSAVTKGDIQIIVPSGIENNVILPYDESNLENTIYKPNELSKDGEYDQDTIFENYNIILEYVHLENVTINEGVVLSGRTLENGNAIIKIANATGAVDTKYAISKNDGVISNIYFKTSGGEINENTTAQNVALVGENKGVITNVYAYGLTESQYSIANTNNGQIIKSASATIYLGSKSEIYGLVNKNFGFISDTYSTNFGHTKNSSASTKIYAFANENSGTIENSFYYIPDVMKYENNVKGLVKTTNQGTTSRCENNEIPSFTTYRSTIWTEENGHAQIIGFKDIEGAIVLKLKLVSGGDTYENGTVIYDLSDIRLKLTTKEDITNRFDYEILFYQTESLSYSIVRFNNGDNFVSYINSLEYTQIPQDTIIIIDGDITIETEIKAFSIPENSMLVGRWITTDKDGNVIEGRNSKIIYGRNESLQHEIITQNDGIIANITFENFSLKNGDIQSKYFAPIKYNYSIIYGITFNNLSVDGGYTEIVSGVVSINGNSGRLFKILLCGETNIYSCKWYNRICNLNYAGVDGRYNCHYSDTIIISGNQYSDPISIPSINGDELDY